MPVFLAFHQRLMASTAHLCFPSIPLSCLQHSLVIYSVKNIPIWVTNKPWVNFFCETLLKSTHTHTCIPNSLQEAGKLRPTQNNLKIPQCDAAPTLVSLTHWRHHLSSDQNQSSWDQFSSLNCSWLLYHFKDKNTYTINQIKCSPAVSIFHGQWICGRGDTFSTHTLLSQTPVTCYFRLFKLLQPPSCWTRWGWYPHKAANGRLPTGIPTGTHTLPAPLKLGETVRAWQFPHTVLPALF